MFKLEGKRLLVSGGSGFIGSFVNRHFSQANDVYSVQVNEVPASRRASGVRYLTGDIRSYQGEGLPDKIDVLVHCAAVFPGVRPGGTWSDRQMLDINVEGTSNLLALGVRKRIRHFVFMSTGGVYGTADKAFKESDPLNPADLYHVAKIKAEQLVGSHGDRFATTILRVSMPYGPGGTHPAMLDILDSVQRNEILPLPEDGAPIQTPIHVRDLVRGVEQVLSLNGRHVFNAGGLERVSRIDLARAVAKRLGRVPRIMPVPIGTGKHLMLDSSRLWAMLGRVAPTRFADHVHEILEGHTDPFSNPARPG
jgi:UDP-glucose 4-epimerase